jgi:hypothetical protein
MEKLLRTAVVECWRKIESGKSTQAPDRLAPLQTYLAKQLENRGIGDRWAIDDAVPGFVRKKDIDVVAWRADQPVVAISCKSLFRNPGGTVPNRLDDAIGEAVNLRRRWPTMRLGYVMIFDMRIAKPGPRSRDWSQTLQEGILRLTSNELPPPIIDSAALFLIKAVRPKLTFGSVDPTLEFEGFFDRLLRG